MSVERFGCGCEFSDILWIRSCQYHKAMAQSFGDKATMAAIILDKHPHDFDAYEDQLVITAGYVRRKEGTKPDGFKGCGLSWHRMLNPLIPRCPQCGEEWKYITAIE